MPPLCWHMTIAQEALARLGHHLLKEHLNCYIVGATAPDVRIITGQARSETHFYELNADHGESGISKLFQAYPQLTQVRGKPQAFLSGYLTHLAVDELWIEQVFRPYFGRESAFEDTLEAKVMDRALQYHMDWKERLNRDRVQQLYEYIFAADLGEEAPLIELPTLQRWQEFVKNILSQEPSWARFGDFLRRRFAGTDLGDEEKIRDFLEALPDLLERTLQHVSLERVAAFREDAITRAAAAVRNYLS